MHSMLHVLTCTFDNIQNHKNTALILFDIKKAFGIVNYNILLNKSQHYGNWGTALKLFTSFLIDRHQYVSINNVNSNKNPMQFGISQRSLPGLLLFTLGINDLNNCSIIKPKLFADDTYFVLQHENSNQSNVILNQQIKEKRLTDKSWITKGVLISIKTKNRLYKKYFKNKNGHTDNPKREFYKNI